MASSFVAYAGVFSRPYRDWLKREKATSFLLEKGVPASPSLDVLQLLTDDAEKAL